MRGKSLFSKELKLSVVTKDKQHDRRALSESAKFTLLILQPGAGNRLYNTYKKEWHAKGFAGCTKELQETDRILKNYMELGVNVYFVSTMPANDIQKAAINKKVSSGAKFISDPEGLLANIKLETFSEKEGHRVYPPQAQLFNAEGYKTWSKSIDREQDTVASLFKEVSKITGKLHVKASGGGNFFKDKKIGVDSEVQASIQSVPQDDKNLLA